MNRRFIGMVVLLLVVGFYALGTGFDFCGESVGFFWLSACMVEAIIARIQSYLEQGNRDIPYEDAIRDVMGTPSDNGFSFEDITLIEVDNWHNSTFPL